MPDLNWNMLAAAPQADFAGNFRAGQNDQTLRRYAQNPNDPRSINALATIDPRLAMQAEERGARQQDRAKEERAALLQKAHEHIIMTGRLLDSVKDEASYQQARQAASGIGIDPNELPPNYDPNWVQQQKIQVHALTGQVEHELMAVAQGTKVIDKGTGKMVFDNPAQPRLIPTQPGGGVYNADTGGWAVRPQGTPDPNQQETIAQDEQGNTVRYNPQTNAWEPVQGGASPSNGSQTFP